MNAIVIEIISKLLDIDSAEISLHSSFKELAIDNMDLAEIIVLIEKKLKITAENDLYDTKTVGELINQLNTQISKN
jgi:acyl carrier protein